MGLFLSKSNVFQGNILKCDTKISKDSLVFAEGQFFCIFHLQIIYLPLKELLPGQKHTEQKDIIRVKDLIMDARLTWLV